MRLLFPLLLVSLAQARLPTFLWGRPTNGGFLNPRLHPSWSDVIQGEGATNNTLTTAFFDNLIDHFGNNKQTYKQKYWYNSAYTQNKNIVFLMIQGESPADDHWASYPGLTYLTFAKLYGADVFQLEHRCFGASRPYPDLSFPNIKACTIDQALADVNSFIAAMNVQYNFTNPKWVTFGGSYPGALTALFQQQYPNVAAGGVASSAPMWWTLDFYEYAQVVESVLLQTDPACQKAVGDAFSQMQTLSLTNEGRDKLNNYFNLDPPFVHDKVTQLDIDNFFSNMYGTYQGVIQYTYDGRNDATIGGMNARNLCLKMTDSTVKDVIVRVNNTINWVNQMTNTPLGPFPNNYTDMMVHLSNTFFDDANGLNDASARGWMWLCCNEIGSLQTTDQGRNVFQQSVPLNYYLDMCTQMFDPSVDVKFIRDNNIQTLKKYGGAIDYKGTNVVLPNGSLDPWHVLGAYNADTSVHRTPILIQGTAHCSDMYAPYAGEPAALVGVRKQIQKEVEYFLGL